MADADEVWQQIRRADNVRYSALVPNLRGAQRALAAGFTEIEVVVSASDTHNRKNVNRTTAESLDDIAAILQTVHEAGATCQVIVSTAWGCPYEGEVPVARVIDVASRAIADGADGLSYGDTTGMATPGRVDTGLHRARRAQRFRDTPLNLHFHNTRGAALANVLAALQLWASPTSMPVFGGLGGCPYAPGATGNGVHRGPGAHGRGHGCRQLASIWSGMIDVARRWPRAWSAERCRAKCCAPGRGPRRAAVGLRE